MHKATAVEKRFFPWSCRRFVDTLLRSVERLHWSECEITGSALTARATYEMKLGESFCPMELTLNATWREIGEGIEATLSVSEEQHSWSIIECKKHCQVLLNLMHLPLSERKLPDDLLSVR